jgi:uncharacterized protein YjiS (DUF1127 family)
MTCADQVSSALLTIPAPTPAWPDRSWREWLAFIPRRYGRMWERRRQHDALLQLDDRLLADIGLSREQARREAGKWF